MEPSNQDIIEKSLNTGMLCTSTTIVHNPFNKIVEFGIDWDYGEEECGMEKSNFNFEIELSSIVLRSCLSRDGFEMRFTFDKKFTLYDLQECIEKTELESRKRKSAFWFGEIDTHHTFFEGLGKVEGTKEPTYIIYWGS